MKPDPPIATLLSPIVPELSHPHLEPVETADAGVELRDADEVFAILSTGARCRHSGELVVVSPDGEGRIYLYGGGIAWAHCTTHAEHLGDVMRREAAISAEDFAQAMQTSRREGKKLAHTLMRMNLVNHAIFRRCLELHVGNHLAALVAMEGPLTADFEFDTEHRFDRSLMLSLPDALEAAGLWR